MDLIESNYKRCCDTHGDISEHLPTLARYSRECSTISEMGVRTVVSTWAFLKGLLENNSYEKKLICVDIEDAPNIQEISNFVRNLGVDMTFLKCDSATVNIPQVDLLFIDTFHVYGHLKRELAKHHASVKKYIIMHDTVSDAIYGEARREHFNIEQTMKNTGYSLYDITHGMIQAIYEFLADHPEWRIEADYKNNNGLMVLKRV